jgi:SAM-dependent methyltransferase
MNGSPDRPVRYQGFHGLSWVSRSELAFLVGLLPERGLFLEIGTASGVTAALVADARPGLTVLCQDTFNDHDAAHVVGNEPCRVDHWRRNQRRNMVLWLGPVEWLPRIGPGLLPDAILVDAGHEEPDVARDLDVAGALLAPGGTLFVHDYAEPKLPGVRVAADRFAAREGFEAIADHWTMRAMRRCRHSGA